LQVIATLNERTYHTGEQVTDEEMDVLKMRTHPTFPDWNYTIAPQITERPRRM
jgi:hypothetical protein